MRRIVTFTLVVILGVAIASPALAHFLWVNVDNYSPKPGQQVTISMGWGHKFPEDEQLSVSLLEKLYIVSPEGKTIPLEIKPQGKEKVVAPVKVKLEKPGTYLVVAKIKPGFMTITATGHAPQSKKGLKDAVKGYCYRVTAKAIISVGEPSGKALQKKLDQRHQVVPLQDPGKLKKDDYLPVKMILDDKPFSYAWLYSTYAGFSPEPETFAYTTRADGDGKAKVKILKPGKWLILASNETPYPDREEADVYYFTDTLTFEIK